MADSTGGSLNAAYEAIKAKDLARARDVLSAYLVDNPNDVDAWWLYSYAVMDVEQGRKALETVLRLDPAYPGARDLLTELESVAPAPAAPVSTAASPPAGIKPISHAPESAKLETTIEPEDEAEFGFADDTGPDSGRFRRLLIAGLAAAAVIAIVLLVFILPNLNPRQGGTQNTAEPTTTSIAFGATELPTEDSAAAATDVTNSSPTVEGAATDILPTADSTVVESPTTESATIEAPTTEAPSATDIPAEPTSASGPSLQTVYDALASYSVVTDSAGVETTELGQTVSVTVCAVSSELRSVLPAVLTSLAAISPQLPAEAEAVGARFVDCTDNAPLRFVALEIADARAYATGTLTDADLRSRFVPLP